MKRLVAAAALATLALAPRAHAQLGNPVHFGVSGGVTLPTSDAAGDRSSGDPNFKSDLGYNASVHLGFHPLLLPVGLRIDGSWNQLGGKTQTFNDPSLNISARSKIDRRIISGTVNAVLMPPGLLVARPYLIGGVGAYNVRHAATATADGLGSSSYDQSKTSVGLNGGAGIRFGLSGLNAFVEARYHYVFDERKLDGACNDNANCQQIPHKATTFVPVSLGIMF